MDLLPLIGAFLAGAGAAATAAAAVFYAKAMPPLRALAARTETPADDRLVEVLDRVAAALGVDK